MSYSIKVMSSDGRPARSQSVSVHYSGIIGSHDSGYTDEDGWVTLWVDSDGLIIETVYINGNKVSTGGHVYPGDTLSFTI